MIRQANRRTYRRLGRFEQLLRRSMSENAKRQRRLRALGDGARGPLLEQGPSELLERTRSNLELHGVSGRAEPRQSPLAAAESDGAPWYEGVAERLGETQRARSPLDGLPGRLPRAYDESVRRSRTGDCPTRKCLCTSALRDVATRSFAAL